jgi:hypothetical protein
VSRTARSPTRRWWAKYALLGWSAPLVALVFIGPATDHGALPKWDEWAILVIGWPGILYMAYV